jgi:large subunit ribosomal protein L5
MWEFLYRLLSVALPTIRDFRGVPSKLDGQGNYTLGITDFSIFPEITLENVKKTMGLDVTIVTSANTDDEARELLKLLGMPFRRVEAQSAQPKPTAA